MANAVNVFPAGMRLTDSDTGAPLEGAIVNFYNAGTTIPKTVYSDAELATPIGTSVTTDSLGYPTSNGAKTLVYTDTGSYKIEITDANSVLIASHDNVKGAVVAGGTSSTNVTFTRPIEEKGGGYTITSSDQSKVFRSIVSNAAITFTLPSALTVGGGWLVTIQHSGSSSFRTIVTCGTVGQTITEGGTSFGGNFVLSTNGEEATFVSNGSNWIVIDHSVPHIKSSNGIISVTSRLAAPPASPTSGDLYILTAAGGASTAWAGYSQHDVAQYLSGTATSASSWTKFTPPTDAGWVAFVKNEDTNYQFQNSGWASLVPSGTIMMHAAATAPSGWFECNGQAVSRTTYAALFAVIGTTYGAGDGSTTFKVPDLRGYFVRGFGTNSDGLAASGATFGATQQDDYKSHTHPTDGTLTGNKHAVSKGSDGQLDYGVSSSVNANDADYVSGSKTGTSGGSETRPKNVALLYIIKY